MSHLKHIFRLAALSGVLVCVGCAGTLNEKFAQSWLDYDKQQGNASFQYWVANKQFSPDPVANERMKQNAVDLYLEQMRLTRKVAGESK